MRVEITSHLGDLVGDMTRIATTAKKDMAVVVKRNAKQGNKIAKAYARNSAGEHGKWYPDRFSAEALTPLEWEYGPSGHPQGEMSFEFGSRNQPPHLDLAKSADLIGPRFARDVAKLPDRWFW